MTPEARRFTHVDPFEDTESDLAQAVNALTGAVSPTSIRSRILKVAGAVHGQRRGHVSPTSIRSRILKGDVGAQTPAPGAGFTHVDPFEDTESACGDGVELPVLEFHPRRSVRGY